jgi:small nuclear ribonucleoprotein (snRNP)-like protein
LTPLYFEWSIANIEAVAQALNLVSTDELSSMPVSSLILAYTLHFSITILIGFVVGKIDDDYLNPERVLDRRRPWEYAFDEMQSEQVEITLSDGTVVRGRFNEAAWAKNEVELYIEDPEEIEYESGEQVGEPIDLGRSILLTGSSIEYVAFIEEDPDKTVEPELPEELIEAAAEEISKTLRESGEQIDLSEVESTEDPDAEESDEDTGSSD